ncbi:hypothetical protein HJFPF1_00225 [Paramyrothecium foliicola]|nr:hypothetical protein HJFPF1_00225 [Paramyrothecium foliicola]
MQLAVFLLLVQLAAATRADAEADQTYGRRTYCSRFKGRQDDEYAQCVARLRAGQHERPPRAESTSSSSSGPPDNCGAGGECDCSLIEDRNSDEYFQCVTNPNCEHCWISTLTTSTTVPSTTAPLPAPTTTDYRTMPPGTYTETLTDGSVNVIIVIPAPATSAPPSSPPPPPPNSSSPPPPPPPPPPPAPTTPLPPAPTAEPESTTRITLTTTSTLVVTVPASQTSVPGTTTTPALNPCPASCDCAGIVDKQSDETRQVHAMHHEPELRGLQGWTAHFVGIGPGALPSAMKL